MVVSAVVGCVVTEVEIPDVVPVVSWVVTGGACSDVTVVQPAKQESAIAVSRESAAEKYRLFAISNYRALEYSSKSMTLPVKRDSSAAKAIRWLM